MYNLIEYSNSYPKTSGSLWKNYRDETNVYLEDSESFKLKIKVTISTPADGNTKGAKLAVPLKYLSKFRRTLEMLFWNGHQFVSLPIQLVTCAGAFALINTKLYTPVVT